VKPQLNPASKTLTECFRQRLSRLRSFHVFCDCNSQQNFNELETHESSVWVDFPQVGRVLMLALKVGCWAKHEMHEMLSEADAEVGGMIVPMNIVSSAAKLQCVDVLQ
jgi:hypothetical protein